MIGFIIPYNYIVPKKNKKKPNNIKKVLFQYRGLGVFLKACLNSGFRMWICCHMTYTRMKTKLMDIYACLYTSLSTYTYI